MKSLQLGKSASLILLPVLLYGQNSLAATGQGTSTWLWNLIIASIVLVFTLASAALPVAAIRQWRRYWRGAAIFPMLTLLFWIGLIVISRSMDLDSHRLWPFEIFAWAMLNMIYMVALMTCKRILERSDEEKAASS